MIKSQARKSRIVPTEAVSPPIDEWAVRNAVETLQRAEVIRADKTLMHHVKREAKKQQKALEKVCSK